MLITSHRHTSHDLAAWDRDALMDRIPTSGFAVKVERAKDTIRRFIAAGPAYLGVSWGKDSVTVADLVMRTCPEVPLVYAVAQPMANPESPKVRDAFLARWPHANYFESTAWVLERGPQMHAPDAAFEAFRRYIGISRYLSGVRADESAIRAKSALVHGDTTDNTCRPLLRWTARSVFHYLHINGLPVHPNYAMNMGGKLDRDRLRVGTIGGMRGRQFGRRHIDARYYYDELDAIEKGELPPHLERQTEPSIVRWSGSAFERV
jgi:phosphoadenosine phosphosulfate reductase